MKKLSIDKEKRMIEYLKFYAEQNIEIPQDKEEFECICCFCYKKCKIKIKKSCCQIGIKCIEFNRKITISEVKIKK